jgi:DNA-binding IclR family transcriptional regulator
VRDPQPDPPLLGVIGKVAVILDAFTAQDRGVGFAELQRRTGLPKATLHRLTGELVTARLLDRVDGRFRLGGHLFELGMRASLERGLVEVATPYLEDLYERTHETVHLGLREGLEVVYILKIGGHRPARAPSRLGGRMPLHATAIGKALLAYAAEDVRKAVLGGPLKRLAARTLTAPGVLAAQLAEIVASGVAFEFEESAVGIVCVAAPILAGGNAGPPGGVAEQAIGGGGVKSVLGGGVVAAVSVTGPAGRFHPRRHADAVRTAAAGISAALARR